MEFPSSQLLLYITYVRLPSVSLSPCIIFSFNTITGISFLPYIILFSDYPIFLFPFISYSHFHLNSYLNFLPPIYYYSDYSVLHGFYNSLFSFSFFFKDTNSLPCNTLPNYSFLLAPNFAKEIKVITQPQVAVTSNINTYIPFLFQIFYT